LNNGKAVAAMCEICGNPTCHASDGMSAAEVAKLKALEALLEGVRRLPEPDRLKLAANIVQDQMIRDGVCMSGTVLVTYGGERAVLILATGRAFGPMHSAHAMVADGLAAAGVVMSRRSTYGPKGRE
jgi:hypothetical protein